MTSSPSMSYSGTAASAGRVSTSVHTQTLPKQTLSTLHPSGGPVGLPCPDLSTNTNTKPDHTNENTTLDEQSTLACASGWGPVYPDSFEEDDFDLDDRTARAISFVIALFLWTSITSFWSFQGLTKLLGVEQIPNRVYICVIATLLTLGPILVVVNKFQHTIQEEFMWQLSSWSSRLEKYSISGWIMRRNPESLEENLGLLSDAV